MDPDLGDSFRRHLEQRIGRTLCNKYTIEKLLGIGGMASVYRGTHRNGNRVALKVLHTELSVSQDIRERFLREGYVANRVDHPGAVRVLDDDTAEDGAVFLVMELLEGETLEDYILREGGTLSPHDVIPLACQVLDVLTAAHEKGIVHRDIKPENLFIEKRARSIKVLDFGIARFNDATRQATRTGRVMGTPVYMAPEQARGETKLVDGQTDVWAVGATLFRALTGRFVHDSETPEMVMIMAATQPAPPLRHALPGAASQIAEVVDRALAMRKDQRWGSAAAMAAALRGLPLNELSQERPQGGILKTADRTLPLQPPPPVIARAGAGIETFTFDGETEQAAPRLSATAPVNKQASTTAGLAEANDETPRNVASRTRTALAFIGVVLALSALGTVALKWKRSASEPAWAGISHGTSAVPSVESLPPPPTTPSATAIAAEAAPRVAATVPLPPAPVRQAAPTQPPKSPVAAGAGMGGQAASGTIVAASAAPAASVCKPKKIITADGTPQWVTECTKK